MNYLSRPYQQNQPVSMMPDLNLAINTIDTLQTRYDANKAIVDQMLSQYEMLKGIRDSDNEYIANKVAQVKSQIDSYGNLRLEHASTRDSITKTLQGVLKDPIVRDAVLSKNIQDGFNAEMKKKQEKGDGSFNVKNYQDALEQGGLEEYKAGKTNKLTGFTYFDYVDVTTSLSEKASKYAKDFGLQERYLGTDTSNPYYYEDKYGKVITKEEVYSHLKNSLTDKEKTQMAIDTRQSLGKYSDVEYTTVARDFYTNRLSNMRQALTEVEAKKKSEGTDKYNEVIASYQDVISNMEKKVKNDLIPKEDMYDIYADRTLKNIASSYDIKWITKIDRDKLPFEIMKFNTETSLKLREIEAEESGTPLVRETPDEEVDLTDTEKIQKSLYRSASSFDQYLMANVDGYANMTEQQKWDYKMNFNPKDLSVKGNTPTAQVLYEEFTVSQKAYANLVSDSDELITQQVKQSFNALSEGKANLGNLSITMPLTAKIIQAEKGVQFDSLPEAMKKGLVAEWSANKLQYDTPSNKDVETMYRNVVIRNKNILSKEGSDSAKGVLKVIQPSTQYTESVGYAPWEFSKAGASIAKQVIDGALNKVQYGFRAVFYGKAKADEMWAEDSKIQQKDLKKAPEYFSRGVKSLVDRVIPFEDTNITELEERDLAVRNGRTSQDVASAFYSLDNNILKKVKNQASNFQENIKEHKAFNFSTEVKEQKGMASALRAVVVDSGNPLPDKTNDYTLSREGASWRIDYTSDEERQSILVPKIDQSIVGVIDQGKANWLKSPKNPNVLLEPQVFTPTLNPNDTYNRVRGFVDNIRDIGILPPQAIQQMLDNPSMTPFASVSEYTDRVKKQFGKDFYEVNKPMVDNILSTTYTAVPYSTGEAFTIKIKYKDEQGVDKIYYPQGIAFPEKDNTALYMTYLSEIEKLKLQRIQSLRE